MGNPRWDGTRACVCVNTCIPRAHNLHHTTTRKSYQIRATGQAGAFSGLISTAAELQPCPQPWCVQMRGAALAAGSLPHPRPGVAIIKTKHRNTACGPHYLPARGLQLCQQGKHYPANGNTSQSLGVVVCVRQLIQGMPGHTCCPGSPDPKVSTNHTMPPGCVT